MQVINCEEPLEQVWCGQESIGRTMTRLRHDSHIEAHTHHPVQIPHWVMEEDMEEACHHLHSMDVDVTPERCDPPPEPCIL